ncbi:MAG TPA: hypothetical protein VJC10_00475 [Patescibacteria group bacterium]|nr:hypothetical protein [Patescibacteria group bacterium]
MRDVQTEQQVGKVRHLPNGAHPISAVDKHPARLPSEHNEKPGSFPVPIDQRGYSAEVQAFIEARPGFLPEKYDPTQLANWIAAKQAHMTHYNGPLRAQNSARAQGSEAHRDHYHSRTPVDVLAYEEAIARVGVFNSYNKPDGDLANARLFDADASGIVQEARELLANGSYFAIFPFHREPETIQRNLEYGMSRVGADNVIGVGTGNDAESMQKARETNATIIDQKEMLSCINWDLLIDQGILPADYSFLDVHAKGETILAGVLAAYAMGQLDDKILAFHDTDVKNPNPDTEILDDYDQPDRYGALEHLATARLGGQSIGMNDIRAVHLMRTGEGRNNESWTYEANKIAESSDPKVAEMGLMAAQLAWPLTGERDINGNLLKTLIYASGMGIETIFDLQVSGIDAAEGTRGVAEIANPYAKAENRLSPRDRELTIVMTCAKFAGYLSEHSKDVGRVPHEWTIDDIALFNNRFGGSHRTITAPSRDDHHPNEIKHYTVDFVYPSIQQFEDMGAINMPRAHDLIIKARERATQQRLLRQQAIPTAA